MIFLFFPLDAHEATDQRDANEATDQRDANEVTDSSLSDPVRTRNTPTIDDMASDTITGARNPLSDLSAVRCELLATILRGFPSSSFVFLMAS
jgi:hypothetical protein